MKKSISFVNSGFFPKKFVIFNNKKAIGELRLSIFGGDLWKTKLIFPDKTYFFTVNEHINKVHIGNIALFDFSSKSFFGNVLSSIVFPKKNLKFNTNGFNEIYLLNKKFVSTVDKLGWFSGKMNFNVDQSLDELESIVLCSILIEFAYKHKNKIIDTLTRPDYAGF